MNNFVVIPAYNEASKITSVLKLVKRYVDKVIVVDDGSVDNTFEVAKQQQVMVVRHAINLGKGAALKTGCGYALELGADKIVVLDADGQHDPQEIPKFLEALNRFEIVYSSRQRSSRMPVVLRFGNSFINIILKSLFATSISDSQCGYRAFTAAAYRKVRWSAADYFMETEMILRASKNKLKYWQIPIKTIYSDNYKGTTVLDGVKIVCKIIWGRFLL